MEFQMPDYSQIVKRAANLDASLNTNFEHFHNEFSVEYMKYSEFRNIQLASLPIDNISKAFIKTLDEEFRSDLHELEMDGWIRLNIKGEIIAKSKLFTEKRDKTGINEYKNQNIPGSDRFVRVDHNNHDVIEATELLENLEVELKTRNDLPMDADQARAILSEIRGLLIVIQEKSLRLSVIALSISANGTLGYLRGKFAEHALAGLTGAIIAALMKAFGVG